MRANLSQAFGRSSTQLQYHRLDTMLLSHDGFQNMNPEELSKATRLGATLFVVAL